jgi:DNA polymerase
MTLPIVSVDAETLGFLPLQTVGPYQYIGEPRSRCAMLAFHRIGDPGRPFLWLEGDPVPQFLIDHIVVGGLLAGWNSIGFDRLVWDQILVPRHGFPAVPGDSWLDSAQRGAGANLPRSLDGCAAAVGVAFQKDLKDNARIRRITDLNRTIVPAPVGVILRNPHDFDPKLVEDLMWLAERCVQDVEMEERTLVLLPSWFTMEPWLNMPAIDRKINDRGILMDAPLIKGMADAAAYESARLNDEINDLTRGLVPKHTRIGALKEWLVREGVELPLKDVEDDPDEDTDPEDEPTGYPEKKETVGGRWRLRKSDIADLLARPDVPDHCRTALEIRAEAAKASVAKLRRMLAMIGPDGRLRGSFILGGAQQTLRWSNTGVQAHNLIRDAYANLDEIAEVNNLDPKRDRELIARLADDALRTAIEVGRTGDPELMRMMFTRRRKDAQGREYTEGVTGWISRMLRRVLCAAQGYTLLNGDFAQIEARIPMWLSGQEDKVQTYARGEDMYRRQAAPIFGLMPEQLSKQQRQIGKVTILACGFAGGTGAFTPMAMNYGVRVSKDEAIPIVQGFRDDNPMLVQFWNNNLQAAMYAVTYPGQEFWVPPKGLVSWFMQGDCLLMRLPSGRCLRYWQPRFRAGKWPDGSPKEMLDLTSLFIKGRAVFRRNLWRGIICENAVQSIAADLLANSLAAADRENLPVPIHVHDSIAAEVPEERAESLLPLFRSCMLDVPAWAAGLPVHVEADISARFG